MSSLVKMSIQGIRSFGPDDQDKQVLKFYSPLTLIQGQNGTGKTTIIECLKYITTGSMPQGGKLQATFIHDPKIAHETTVKGQVRLQFNNITGQRFITSRSIQATQMPKSIKTSSVDSTISVLRPDGEREDLTKRCGDLDREMVSLLGVGKPVLESVIFCHQEDSCWPLSEGKALKAKFDDIFASTRYVKALEVIIKERKEKHGDIKNYQVELRFLKQNKDKSQQIEGDLAETMTRYQASRDVADEIKGKLDPIEEKLLKISSKEGDIHRLHTEMEKLKSERDEMERSLKELQDNIEQEFTGSSEELEEKLSDFVGVVKEYEEKLKQYDRENQRLEVQLNEVSEMKSTLLLEMGKLEQEAKAHQENIHEREMKIKKIAEHYTIKGFTGAITDAKVEEFQQKMDEQRKSLQKAGQEQRAELEEREVKVQAKIDQIRQKMASLQTEIKLKEETMEKNKMEVRNINKKLSRVEGSSGRLAELKRELKHNKQERDEAERSINIDDLKSEIETLSSEKTRLDASFKQLDVELAKMHQESAARTQLDMQKKEKTGREDKIRKLLAKNEDGLTDLLGELPEDRIGRHLEEYLYKLDKEVERETKALENHRMELAGKRQQHSSLQEQLANKKAELANKKERIDSECDDQDFEEARDKLEQDLREKNDDKGVLEGTSAMFNKFKSKLHKKNAPCPLCHRVFDEESEITELVDELETKLRTVPTRLEHVNDEIKSLEQRFHRILQLEPDTKLVIKLRDEDIPELEGRIKKVAARVEELTSLIATKETALKAKDAKSKSGQGMVPDLTTIDRFKMEVRDINKKIATQSGKISGGEDGRTLQQVQRERNDAQESLETARSSYERKQKKLMDHSRLLAQLDTSMNEMTKEKLDIERDLQEQKEIEQRREELLQNNEILSVEIMECQEQVDPCKVDLNTYTRERQEISNEKDSIIDKTRDQISKLQQRTRDIRVIQDNIERYLKAGRDAALEDCKEKQNSMETKAAALETKRSVLMTKIERRREDLQTQKLQERNLQDNLTLRRKQKMLKEKSDLIKEKKENLGDLDFRSLEKERQKLHRQEAELRKEKHQAEGRQQGLMDQIRIFKKDLQGELYKDAGEKYRNMSQVLRTTEHVCSDLEKYYKALDKTIMTYHRTKIDEINKIIRDLWRTTYKGHDIETIEIRSDEDEGFQLGKRRNFNYRVVMIKGEVAIDMRGRCSAGQKVLASLIIRLALAETFCLNCGVLALDEPTTNLDRENIESLAYALVEIIKSRSKQKNFQMLIITHDEDFVELLGRSDFVDKFIKVRKNEFGCSRLVEAKVCELGTR